MSNYLKLENQVCFPVYTLAKEIINRYRPILQELDLTYPQYLVMLVLWEHKKQTVSELGCKLNLDSGTLTPLLKRLEAKEYLSRTRDSNDERVVNIILTTLGEEQQTKAQAIPQKITEALNIPNEQLLQLKNEIDSIIDKIEKEK